MPSIGRCSECPRWLPFTIFWGDPWEHMFRAHGEVMPEREVFDRNLAQMGEPTKELVVQAVNLSKAKALKFQQRDNSQAPDLDAVEIVKERGREEDTG